MNKKVILMILDGWGLSPDPAVSAIDNARTPFIDSLYKKYPNATLRTDGLNVGLPEGQMGNSEVGHMNLGAGRKCLCPRLYRWPRRRSKIRGSAS